MKCEYGGNGGCQSEATQIVYADDLPVMRACDIHAGDLMTQGFTIKPLLPKTTEKKVKSMPKKSNQTTPELENMPEPDGVGLAAQNFRTAIEKLDAAKEAKVEAMDALYKALVSAKRTSICIDGYTFERQHTGPKDSIKVIKPK